MSTSGGFLSQIVGCMSQGADGKPSVAMVEAAFVHHELPWRYVNMEVPPANLEAAVRGAHAMGFRGFNLSMPHKVAVIPHLAGLGESASLIGAVNCVVRRGDRFIGENTDGKGFLAALSAMRNPRGQHVTLFGAGGAARAIAVELGLAGAASVTVVNRSAERGEALVATLRDKAKVNARFEPWRGDYRVPDNIGIVVNGTSIGLYDPNARLPIHVDSLRPGMVAADVVFSPPETRFLGDARSRGCVAVDGLGMLVQQGVIGIKYWTGVDAEARVMQEALAKALRLP
jgi:shikimate dehydrogenase